MTKKIDFEPNRLDFGRFWRKLAPFIRKALLVHAYAAEMMPHERILHMIRERFLGLVNTDPAARKKRRKRKRHKPSTELEVKV